MLVLNLEDISFFHLQKSVNKITFLFMKLVLMWISSTDCVLCNQYELSTKASSHKSFALSHLKIVLFLLIAICKLIHILFKIVQCALHTLW